MLPGQLAHDNLCVSQDIALGSCILAAWPAMLVTPAGTLWMPQSSVWTQTNTQRTDIPRHYKNSTTLITAIKGSFRSWKSKKEQELEKFLR